MTTVRGIASLAFTLVLAAALAAPASAVTLQHATATTMAQPIAAKVGDTVTVTPKVANLRGGPSTKSKKIASMAKGTKLQVTEVAKGGWLKVKGPAGDGYVLGTLVK